MAAAKPENTDLRRAKVIIVLGGPGCGKGTHCALFSKKSGLVHVSTGDLLRDEVAAKTTRGQQLKEIMDKGELVPTEIVMTLLKEAMIKHMREPSCKGFLLDGYPRALDQAKTFEKEIAPVELVLYLNVSDDLMKERMLKRAQTSGRSDDNLETLAKRLATYHSLTQPVIDYYSKQRRLITIEAGGSVEDGQEKIVKAVKI
jgi:adenylate kinase (isozyme 1 subfamily)